MSAYDDSISKELHLYFMTKDELTAGQTIPTYTFFEQIDNDTYTNADGTFPGGVVSESMSLTMGVLESSKFELGSYVIPEMQVTIFYHNERYKNKLVRAWITQEDDENLYGIITGEVYQENLSEDRQTITLVIRNILYNAFNCTVKWGDFFPTQAQTETYIYRSNVCCDNPLSEGQGSPTYPTINIYKEMIDYIFSYACGVFDKANFGDVVSSTLKDNMARYLYTDFADFNYTGVAPLKDVITQVAKPLDDNIYYSLGQIWKWFGEMAGVHWIIDRPNFASSSDITSTTIQIGKDFYIKPFRMKEIDILTPSDTLYPLSQRYPLTGNIGDATLHTLPFYISCIYDEYIKTSYSYMAYDNVSLPIRDFPSRTPPLELSSGNPFFDYAFLGSTIGNTSPTIMAWWTNAQNLNNINNTNALNNYVYNLDKIMYATLDSLFDLNVKLGDNLAVNTNEGFIAIIPVISYQVNGINNLRVTYRTTAIKEG